MSTLFYEVALVNHLPKSPIVYHHMILENQQGINFGSFAFILWPFQSPPRIRVKGDFVSGLDVFECHI